MLRKVRWRLLVLIAVGILVLGALFSLFLPADRSSLAIFILCLGALWLLALLVYGLARLVEGDGGSIPQTSFYKSALDNHFEAIFLSVDQQGVIVASSGGALGRIEASLEEGVVGKKLAELADDGAAIRQDINRVFDGQHFVATRMMGGGTFRCHYFPERDRQGEVMLCHCVGIDQSVMHELRAELRLARQVINRTTDAIVVTDAQRRIVTVNDAFTNITGFGAKEMAGDKIDLPSLVDLSFASLREIASALKKTGFWQGEVRARHKNGEFYAARLSLSEIREKGVLTHYLVCFVDISDILHGRGETLRTSALEDILTGLASARLFYDRLEQALFRAKRMQNRLGLYRIDIDNFQLINETMGYSFGDAILKEAAQRLRLNLREMDTLGRIGDDEFAVVIENFCDNDELELIARKLLSCFEAPYQQGEKQLEVSASIGVAVFPEEAADQSALLKAAKSALLRAKAMGRNGHFFLDEKCQGRLREQPVYPSELRLGLAREQLTLLYQPQIELVSGQITGCEALLRWNHRNRGQLLPDGFLALAEGKELMTDIGHWVLQEACGQFAQWRDRGLNLGLLAINLSADQLESDSFFEDLDSAMRLNQITPEKIQLEIQEQTVLGGIGKIQGFLARAKVAGVRVAIDDFGLHPEGFCFLTELSVDCVKLDHRLLRASMANREFQSLIGAIVALGKAYDFTVVGIGVEEYSQLQYLAGMGCEQVQGFYYAKPLSGEDFYRFYQSLPMNRHP